jgi:Ca2+-binding RTX toxin-like protein
MVWTGTFFNSSDELFAGGLEGYFTISASVGGGTPTRLDTTTTAPVSFGMDNFLGRINFFGTNLTTRTEKTPIGSDLEVLTGGTISRITFEYNYNLSRVIDQGGDPSFFFDERFLEPSADIRVPNIDAAALTAAILQSYQARSDQPFLNFLSQDTANFSGTEGVNLINGFNGPDVLSGLGGNDLLSGNGGNDVLDGGAGTDGMNGGEGSDLYLPGPPDFNSGIGDSISDNGTGANDIDTVSYANAPEVVVVDLNFQDGDQSAGWANGLMAGGIEAVVGSNFNDTLMGSDFPESIRDTAADLLIGGPGDDTLFGFGGSDILQGGPGFDTLIGGANGDIANPGPGDTARFNANSSDLSVFFQNDGSVLVAAPGGGVDTLFEMEFIETNDGRFAIGSFTPSNRQLLIGTEGDSPLTGTAGDDMIFGRGGNDTLRGEGGNDVIEGEDGNDTIDAGQGDDTVSGGAGADVIKGRGGGDTLSGDAGADRLKGGGGAD